MKSGFIVLVGILCLPIFAMAQLQPPQLRCVAVNLDGSITLSWIKPVDNTGFQQYNIYYAPNAGGPYVAAPPVTDYNQESSTISGLTGHDLSYYFYMETDGLPSVSDPSETLQTIFMVVDVSPPDFETADLYWNRLHTPMPPGYGSNYTISREYPPGTWTDIDATTALTYTDIFRYCNSQKDIINYRVSIDDPVSGCTSVSSIGGDYLWSSWQQEFLVMDSVSVMADGSVMVSWSKSIFDDTEGYIIFYPTSSAGGDSVNYMPGIDNTYFNDLLASPCDTSFSYATSSIDSCGNQSPANYNLPHKTIWLKNLVYDPCNKSIDLSWTPYINFSPALEGYDILVSTNGGAFERIATVGSSQLSYTHTGLQGNTSYNYMIRAFAQGRVKSSSSCRKSITTYESPEPQYMYTRYATIKDNARVELSFLTDTSAYVINYLVYRSETQGGPYEQIGEIPPSSEPIMAYIDESANISGQSYYYKISVIDTCQNESELANLARTILLTVVANDDRTNDLSWNQYMEWDGNVDHYDVYRLINGNVETTPIASLGPGVTFHKDDVGFLSNTSTLVSYFVEAVEGPGNPWGYADTSRSNTAVAEQASKVWMPTGFIPQGKTQILKPILSFVDGSDYLFIIYNRWGQRVFETQNTGQGWDGKYDGKYAATGVYVFLIRYRNSRNEIEESTGQFTLIDR